MGVVDTFCLNGRVGDIGIKDKTIEIKLVFPNDERTEDELSWLYPIKRGGLATVRIFKAVNREYVPGRRRPERDELGTPLLPGIDNREECHGCGKMVDTVEQAFYVKPAKPGEKEAILCEVCYMVPQPETINPEERSPEDPLVETTAEGEGGEGPPAGDQEAATEDAGEIEGDEALPATDEPAVDSKYAADKEGRAEG